MGLQVRFHAGRVLALGAALACFFIPPAAGRAFSRYASASHGAATARYAAWEFSVNGMGAKGPGEVPVGGLTFIKTGGPDGPCCPYPGQSGYFDVRICPSGTQVSFSWEVDAGGGKPPDGFSLTGYQVLPSHGGAAGVSPLVSGKASGTCRLSGREAFGEGDAFTVRIYWEWEALPDGGGTAPGEYTFPVGVTLSQYVEGGGG